MPLDQQTNGDNSVLTAPIGVHAAGATVTIQTAAAIGQANGKQLRVQIGRELFLVTAGMGTTTMTATATVEGYSLPATHSIGDAVVQVLTAGGLANTETAGGGGGVTDHGALTGLADDDHTQYQLRSEKDSPGGYAGLDGSSKLDASQIPSSVATDAEVASAISTHTGIATAHHTNANDPSANEKAALAGTSGTTPSGSNKLVDNADPRNSDARTPTAHTHTHASTTGQTANDHHSQAHTLGGSDHSDITQSAQVLKVPVRVATTANGTLATAYENGDTVDGVVLTTGDRILLKNQTSGAENGIYVVAASGAPTRATDADAAAEFPHGFLVYVREGTANANTVWKHTTVAAITLGTTALTFSQLGSGGSGLYSAYLCYQDQKSSGTHGGTFTSGADRTRDLNTEVADTGNHGSVASNQITLAAGTYHVEAWAMALSVDNHQLLLYDTTGSATLVRGSSSYNANASTYAQTVALLSGRFTLAVQSVLELRHRCATTRATNGFGTAASFGTETYACVQLWKEA